MTDLSNKIKKLRIEKGYTQEQLGKILNVSTQAVSKWERGGTPDIELLPKIADVLEVSIDTLFDREPKTVEDAIDYTLRNTADDKAFDRAFKMCWAISSGLIGCESLNVNRPNALDYTDTEHKFFSTIQLDTGYVCSRLAQDFKTFFIMPEPEGGLLNKIESLEELQKLFSLFANLDILKIIFFLHSRLNTPVAASLISKNTGISEKLAEKYMQMLLENHLVYSRSVATAKGELISYTLREEKAVIPFLCFADEIHKSIQIQYCSALKRTRPLLY